MLCIMRCGFSSWKSRSEKINWFFKLVNPKPKTFWQGSFSTCFLLPGRSKMPLATVGIPMASGRMLRPSWSAARQRNCSLAQMSSQRIGLSVSWQPVSRKQLLSYTLASPTSIKRPLGVMYKQTKDGICFLNPAIEVVEKPFILWSNEQVHDFGIEKQILSARTMHMLQRPARPVHWSLDHSVSCCSQGF